MSESVPVTTSEVNIPTFGASRCNNEETMEVIFGALDEVGPKYDVGQNHGVSVLVASGEADVTITAPPHFIIQSRDPTRCGMVDIV